MRARAVAAASFFVQLLKELNETVRHRLAHQAGIEGLELLAQECRDMGRQGRLGTGITIDVPEVLKRVRLFQNGAGVDVGCGHDHFSGYRRAALQVCVMRRMSWLT